MTRSKPYPHKTINKHINRRIMGGEIELGAYPAKFAEHNIDAIENVFKSSKYNFTITNQLGSCNSLVRHITPNQTQIYRDSGLHIEIASPECLGPKQAALYEISNRLFVQELIDVLRGELGCNEFCFYNSGRNCNITSLNQLDQSSMRSWGMHINSLTFRELELETIAQYMTGFLMSRWCIIGNGWIGKFGQQGSIRYLLSSRADLISSIMGGSTTDSRSLINTRDEPLADEKYWRRIHDISANHTMTHVSTFLKYGMTDLVLTMIEADLLSPLPRPKDFYSSMVFFNQDLSAKEPITFTNDARWSMLDLQEFCLENAEYIFIEREILPATQEKKEVLYWWRKVIDALRREDIESLSRWVDWAALLCYVVMPVLEKHNLPVEGFLFPEKSKKQVRFDYPLTINGRKVKLEAYLFQRLINYCSLDSRRSIYALLEQDKKVDTIFTGQQLAWAKNHFPLKTRAEWRGKTADYLLSRGINNLHINWSCIIIGDPKKGSNKTLLKNANPYRFYLTKNEHRILSTITSLS